MKKSKTKRTTRRTKNTPSNESTHFVFLLDRTGSMAECLDEAIKGFNSYLDGIQKAKNSVCTVVQFDSQSMETLANRIPPSQVPKLSKENFKPRAMTPLYDAMGQTMVNVASKDGKEAKVLFVTLTDGEENASCEWNVMKVRSKMKELEAGNWTFAHIGCGIDGWKAMTHVAQGTQSSSNILRTDNRNIARSMRKAGGQAVTYASCAIGSMGYAKMKADFWAGDKDDTKDE